MSRDEHDLRVRLAGDLALQIQAVDVRQVDVQDQAPGQVGLGELQVLGGRPEGDDVQVCRGQELLQCFAHAEIVVDDEHDVIVRAHRDALEEIGSVKLNTAPRGVLFVAQTRPWCASTIQREIASPMPMPVSLVVKNGSNTRSTSSSPLP